MASGRAVAPVLREPDDPAAKTTPEFAGLAFGAAHFEAVRQAMAAAVNAGNGSAKDARLGDGRPLVAGKTGVSDIGARSAERAAQAVDYAKRNHALFIGYEPADAPRYAIATVIEHGGDGETAAALARDILALTIDRDNGERGKSGADGSDAPARGGRVQEAG
jgi:penicillin-binding protein 2